MAVGRGADANNINFGPQQLFALKRPKIILYFKFIMIKKKLIRPYLAGWRACA